MTDECSMGKEPVKFEILGMCDFDPSFHMPTLEMRHGFEEFHRHKCIMFRHLGYPSDMEPESFTFWQHATEQEPQSEV